MTLSTKHAARLAIQEHEQRCADRHCVVKQRQAEGALTVGVAIQLFRADDELVEELQHVKRGNRDFKMPTALHDALGQRTYGTMFMHSAISASPDAELWWPWGAAPLTDARCCAPEKVLARAQWLRGRVKCAADPKAAALEAGAAFAEAAAALVRERHPRGRGKVVRIKDDVVVAASTLEDTARGLLRLAAQASNPRTVLRRATHIAVVKEVLRRRALMRPEKRAKSVAKARARHARELAAERRRQRARRKAAHLSLLRDMLRAEGAPGMPTTRAHGPDIKAHFLRVVGL